MAAPLFAAIMEYCHRAGLRLHMPGHAGRKTALPLPFHGMIDLDLTEVEGLDDLHWPSGPIKAAQQLMAQAYGALHSNFLVNGASSGIHSFFMGLPPHSRVLVARNAHRSFYAGMVLSGVNPVYIPCRVNDSGLALAVDARDVDRLLREYSDIQAAAVVSPSYFGTTCRIDRISRVLKNRGIPLMVDEAHGGHFYFHPEYPQTALAGGADVVVNGLHKTLPVLTQGACLHIGASCPAPERFIKACSLLTTTSPSYLIMASLDLAREWMQGHGREALERALRLSRIYRQKISGIKGIDCLFPELMITGVEAIDPLKLTISVAGLGEDGFSISRRLREHWQIEVEWESRDTILAMMSVFHEAQDWERLYQALCQVSAQVGCRPAALSRPALTCPAPRVEMSPREAYFAPRKDVFWENSVGKLCAEMIVPYPPGIPCLLPGEKITAEIFSYIDELKCLGHHIHGLDTETHKISIIDGT